MGIQNIFNIALLDTPWLCVIYKLQFLYISVYLLQGCKQDWDLGGKGRDHKGDPKWMEQGFDDDW